MQGEKADAVLASGCPAAKQVEPTRRPRAAAGAASAPLLSPLISAPAGPHTSYTRLPAINNDTRCYNTIEDVKLLFGHLTPDFLYGLPLPTQPKELQLYEIFLVVAPTQ